MPCGSRGSENSRTVIARWQGEDVDLFTGWDRRNEFIAALDAVVAAYEGSGFDVEISQQFDTFARLRVVVPDEPDVPRKVELVANWRSQPPIRMQIGPVLHVNDVAAGKMSALYTRAEPRDFLDVDAIITSGIHTREELCALAAQPTVASIGGCSLKSSACWNAIPIDDSPPMVPMPDTSQACAHASAHGAPS